MSCCPIRFGKDLKVTIQALGWYPDGTFQPLTDELASVAYWYQSEPHAAFPGLPDEVARRPRINRWYGNPDAPRNDRPTGPDAWRR